jgi:hypothetical protein
MWMLIMLVVGVVAFFSLSGLLHQHVPELAKYLPEQTVSAPAPAEKRAFAWDAYETNEKDGTRTLDISVPASIPYGSQVRLHFGCYRSTAFAYLYPIINSLHIGTVTLNGLAVTKTVNADRIFITKPVPAAFAKELTGIPKLQVTVAYPESTNPPSVYTFNTTGFSIYLPYLSSACSEGLTTETGAN